MTTMGVDGSCLQIDSQLMLVSVFFYFLLLIEFFFLFHCVLLYDFNNK